MIKAVSVIANDDLSIIATLEDGRIVRMDVSSILTETGPVVEPLKQLSEFKKVFVRNGVVTWPTGYDIDPYFLVEEGVLISKTA